jgi:hypothetical protein
MNKKILLISIAVLVTLATIALSIKSTVFRYVLAKKVQHTEQKLGLSISYTEARLKGFTHISMSDIEIVKPSSKISLHVSTINIDMSIGRLLRLNIIPKTVAADSVLLKHCKELQVDSQIVNRTDSTESKENSTLINSGISLLAKYSRTAYKLLVETDYTINNLGVVYSQPIDSIRITTPQLLIHSGNLNATFCVTNGVSVSSIEVIGEKEEKFNVLSYSITPERHFKLPLIDSKLGLHLGFDSLRFAVNGNNRSASSIDLTLQSTLYGVNARHKKLADTTIHIDSTSFLISSQLSSDSASIIAPSYFSVNLLKFPFKLSIPALSKPEYSFSINTGVFPARNIFESIPNGLFETTEKIKVAGDVNFHLNFDIDFNQPDSLHFIAKLEPISFQLINPGNVDFARLNHNFTHYIKLNDSINKAIHIDSSSHQFRPLHQISPYLIDAVIISEDGGFYYHKGFDAEGFSVALARNIKDRRLARGGSTITMQLVKNLYLNRQKNLVRKAEEAIVVWIIETQKLVSKKRILEIYLNIIDWGPNINGIDEAARYYFNKEPIDIELNEAIFLTGIIPQPARFMSYFDCDQNLKEYMQDYYNFIGSTMLQRSMITEEELLGLQPSVNINGSAQDLLSSGCE